MNLENKAMEYLRQRSRELLGKVLIEKAAIQTATVNIENLEYEHHELCVELLRRTDAAAAQSA